MRYLGLSSAVAGALMLGLSGAANAAPAGAALPSLTTLSSADGAVEQVQYWRHRHCHWVKRCGPYRCWWHRHCW